MTLLVLDDSQLAGLTPSDVRRLELSALRRFNTAARFDHAQWDHLVETWNDAMPNERERRHDYCKRHGHQWVALPMEGAGVCRRCVQYRMEEA